MGTKATGWHDHGTFLRVYVDVPYRKNGLPPLAAARAVEAYFEHFNPDAFDPPDPVPETVAAAFRTRLTLAQQGITHVEMSAESPPVPDFDLGVPTLDAGLLPEDDEIIFPRACRVGGCGEE